MCYLKFGTFTSISIYNDQIVKLTKPGLQQNPVVFKC